jgi:hypothetical protein
VHSVEHTKRGGPQRVGSSRRDRWRGCRNRDRGYAEDQYWGKGLGETMWELLYLAVAIAVILGMVTSIWVSLVLVCVLGVLFSYAWATK